MDQGVAVPDVPQPCHALVDLYGQCEQVSGNEGRKEGVPGRWFGKREVRYWEMIMRLWGLVMLLLATLFSAGDNHEPRTWSCQWEEYWNPRGYGES